MNVKFVFYIFIVIFKDKIINIQKLSLFKCVLTIFFFIFVFITYQINLTSPQHVQKNMINLL